MKHLNVLLFAAFLTNIIIAVRASSGEDESSTHAATADGGKHAEESKTTPAMIRLILGPLDRTVTNLELVAKILTKLKTKDLDLGDAARFLKALSLASAKTLVGPNFKILGKIVELVEEYENCHDKESWQNLEGFVQGEIRSFLFLLNRDLNREYVTPEILAPSVTKLLECSVEKAAVAAYTVAHFLISDKNIQDELSKWFVDNPNKRERLGCPYTYVVLALDLMPQL